MRDPRLPSDLAVIGDAGFSVVAASRADAPVSRASSLANELRLYTVRPNVLVIGPVALVEAMLATITAMLLTPVCYWTSDVPLSTLGAERTVVIRDVATWCLDRQEALLTWLSEPSRRPQIIATRSEERCWSRMFPPEKSDSGTERGSAEPNMSAPSQAQHFRDDPPPPAIYSILAADVTSRLHGACSTFVLLQSVRHSARLVLARAASREHASPSDRITTSHPLASHRTS